MDQIIIGVDTHKSNHIGVAISRQDARLGTITIPTTRQGYRDLEAWASEFGTIKAFGIEGTGSYGAGLSRDLLAMGHTVLDVTACHRQRLQGGLVQLLEQLLAAGPEMARDLVVEPVQKWADRRVHVLKAEELPIAQPCRRARGAPHRIVACLIV